MKSLCLCVKERVKNAQSSSLLVRGKGSDSAFGVRRSTTERNNSRQKLEDSTVAGKFNGSNIGAS